MEHLVLKFYGHQGSETKKYINHQTTRPHMIDDLFGGLGGHENPLMYFGIPEKTSKPC